MKELIRKNLKQVQSYQPGKPISEVKRQLKLDKVIKLASNENPFGPSPKVKKALAANLKNINRYPDAACFALRDKVARKLKVSPENLIFGNGSDELIVMALRTFVEKEQEVIVGTPTFLIYEIQAKVAGVKVVKSRLKNNRYNLDDIRSKITSKTRIIFIANPDNPNGTYLNRVEVENFLKSMPKDVIVFFDEAYYEFAPKDFPKTIDYVKSKGNLIVTRTFSKAYSLAGLRVGFGVADKRLIDAMNKVREPFNVNCLAQVAAYAALADPRYMQRCVEYLNKEKKRLYAELDKLDLGYVKSATNFILIKVKDLPSRDVFNRFLREGVIVRDMSAWGLKNYIRVSLGKKSENNKFLKVLKNIVVC